MTQHEQKPESAEFRTREAQIASHFGPHFLADFTEEGLRKELIEAEARGAAEQRRKDEEKRDLISANLDRPGLIEWSVHILGPDDVHPCGSRAEAEALSEETNILAGSTNKGRGDDEFVTYAAYVVPRFKADKETEQRRKDAEGEEPVGFTDQDDLDRVKKGKSGDIYSSPRPEGVDEDYWPIPLYTRPANVAALESRVNELEGEMERRIAEAAVAEREKIAGKLDEVAKHLARPWGSYLTEEGIAVKEACAARVEQEAAAIREGGER